jgi:hypothetical protein
MEMKTLLPKCLSKLKTPDPSTINFGVNVENARTAIGV